MLTLSGCASGQYRGSSGDRPVCDGTVLERRNLAVAQAELADSAAAARFIGGSRLSAAVALSLRSSRNLIAKIDAACNY